MLIPVRCFTCGKVIGNLEGPMERLKEQGYDINEICEKLKVKRYCCKRILLSYIDLTEDLMMYQQTPDQVTLYDGVKNVRIYKGL